MHLGLIPGAGGTQRLPRLIGVEKAIDAITTGRQISATEALDLGLINRIFAGDPIEAGLAYADHLLESGIGPRPVSKLQPPEAADWDAVEERVRVQARGRIAPVHAVRAIRASAEEGFDQGLKSEREIFTALMKTGQREALVHAFFAERSVSKLPELQDVRPREIASVGILGGGTMGAGIATAILLAEIPVVLVETSPDASKAAQERVTANLSGAVRRGKITERNKQDLLSERLRVSSTDTDLSQADLVIEAVFEEMDVKKAAFARLDQICKSGAVLASNTSYLDLNEIAASTSRPQDVIGLHFFSPAHVMKLLEVVVPDSASVDAVATGFALAKRLGKTAVRSGVCDGFIGNRLLNACRTAVDHMVLDGASPFQIDDAMVRFGYPLGPFQVSDLAGLDIGWAMRKRRAPTREAHERVGRYPDILCEQGHLGRKTGKGFYLYEDVPTAGTPNPEVLQIIEDERRARGIRARSFSKEEIQRRYLAAMVNEAAHVLEEGIARRPSDVDVVLLAGYAFPRHFGGPCKWADLNGLRPLLTDIYRFGQDDLHFWRPAPLIERLVSEGRSFDDLNAI